MITGTSVGLTTVFYYASMQYLPASLAIILLFQFVWIVILFEWIFNKTKPSKASMISIILILAGVLFASDILYGSIQRSEEHTSELQSRGHLVCRLLLEKKK